MKSQEGQFVKCDKCGVFDRQFVGCFNVFKRGVELVKKVLGGVGVLSERSDENLKTVRFLCPWLG